MLITKLLKSACPSCGKVGKYGNVNICNNILNRGCNACGERFRYPLPDLKKEIIYLDQFFLSHAFRKRESAFVDAAERLRDMAVRQLIVCPYSSVHTDETHLWRHEQKDELYKFIKQTALGHEFNEAYDIKLDQLHKAFDAFIASETAEQEVEEGQAFRNNIHSWDDYFFIDIAPYLGDLDAMRAGKSAAIEGLIKLFPEWSKRSTSFNEDIAFEAQGYAEMLIQQYWQMASNIGNGKLNSHLDAPINSMYVESLVSLDRNKLTVEERLQRVGNFMFSEHFRNIPYVKISCGIFSVLRKMVKEGSYKNPEKASKKLAGLFYDSECISVFGPYSNAIFIDRAMKLWCEDSEAMVLQPYSTKIFSAANWGDFHKYLDEIELRSTDEHKKALRWTLPELNF